MDRNLSSGSSASSRNRFDVNSTEAPLCHCGRRTKKIKAWTDENPGRRFFRCEIHGFYAWADLEDACGWQKQSLLEGRDQIRLHQIELRQLREALSQQQQPVLQARDGNQSTAVVGLEVEEKTEEISRLEVELARASEREKMLRKFLFVSWGGFFAATAIIVTALRR